MTHQISVQGAGDKRPCEGLEGSSIVAGKCARITLQTQSRPLETAVFSPPLGTRKIPGLGPPSLAGKHCQAIINCRRFVLT